MFFFLAATHPIIIPSYPSPNFFRLLIVAWTALLDRFGGQAHQLATAMSTTGTTHWHQPLTEPPNSVAPIPIRFSMPAAIHSWSIKRPAERWEAEWMDILGTRSPMS